MQQLKTTGHSALILLLLCLTTTTSGFLDARDHEKNFFGSTWYRSLEKPADTRQILEDSRRIVAESREIRSDQQRIFHRDIPELERRLTREVGSRHQIRLSREDNERSKINRRSSSMERRDTRQQFNRQNDNERRLMSRTHENERRFNSGDDRTSRRDNRVVDRRLSATRTDVRRRTNENRRDIRQAEDRRLPSMRLDVIRRQFNRENFNERRDINNERRQDSRLISRSNERSSENERTNRRDIRRRRGTNENERASSVRLDNRRFNRDLRTIAENERDIPSMRLDVRRQSAAESGRTSRRVIRESEDRRDNLNTRRSLDRRVSSDPHRLISQSRREESVPDRRLSDATRRIGKTTRDENNNEDAHRYFARIVAERGVKQSRDSERRMATSFKASQETQSVDYMPEIKSTMLLNAAKIVLVSFLVFQIASSSSKTKKNWFNGFTNFVTVTKEKVL